TIGLTINQATADDEIFALKSSDVAHGGTTDIEADTFFDIIKIGGDFGGGLIRGISESTYGIGIHGIVTTCDTDKDTGATAPVVLYGSKIVGGAILGNLDADANIVAMRGWIGGAWSTRWILDEDGDTWQGGAMYRLALGPISELTIAGGVITVTGSNHTVDTANGADDLVTINGGIDGQILVLRQENAARNVTVKDDVG
ncbi:unnamed protein product, partial [marine sediment metagenome]